MVRSTFTPVQPFNNSSAVPRVSQRINPNQITQTSSLLTKPITVTVVVVVAALAAGMIVAAAIVPIVLTKGNTISETTPTVPTSSSISTSASTSTTTALTLQWNITGTTVAGGSTGVSSSSLDNPVSIALGSANTIYIADANNNRIQKWVIGALTGVTVAGFSNGTAGASLDALNYPVSVALDANDNMYISDCGNHRVMYWPNGAFSGSVYAGVTGVPGNSTSDLFLPAGLYFDRATGNLYIADKLNYRIVRYTPGGSSKTIVAGGNGGNTRYTQLLLPDSVAFDASTNSVIISSATANYVVRWVIGNSNWTLMAGSNTGRSGSTPLLLQSPSDGILDTYGNLYVADSGNHRIQYLRSGELNATTIAGISRSGRNATALNGPYRLALDSQLNLYVADAANNRIQKFSRI